MVWKSQQMLQILPIIKVIKDQIILSNLATYRIEFYNQKGQLTKVVSRDVKGILRPGIYKKDAFVSIGSTSHLSAPVLLSGGYWLTSASWPTNITDPDEYMKLSVHGQAPELEKIYTIDLYDAQGRLLYSLTSQEAKDLGSLQMVDAEGRLYTTKYEPYPQVRRYRVVIEEPVSG